MTDLPPPSGPPPGWYPDPTTSGRGFRWWDGVAWTDQWTEHPEGGHDGLAPVGEWMSELLQLVRSRLGHFFPMIVLLLIPATLLNGLASWYAFNDVVVTTENGGEIGFSDPGSDPGAYGLALGSLVAVLVAGVAMVAVSVRQTQAALTDDTEPWSDSMTDGLRRLPRVLGLMAVVIGALFVLYLVMIVSAAVAPILLLITFPLWVAGTLWLTVRLSLTAVAGSLAPAGVRCLRTSWDLTRSNVWPLLGRMGLLTLFSVSLALLMRLIATPFVALGGGSGTEPVDPGSGELRFADLLGDNPAVFAIGQLFGAIGNGVALVLWAAGFVLVYRDLSGPIEEAT